MGVDTQELQGFDVLIGKLRAIAPALRKKALPLALAAGARLVRDEARRAAPSLSTASRNPYRTPGLLKRSISVRTSKVAKRAGDVGVFVNVRPAKGAKFKTLTTRVFGLKIKTSRMTRATQRGAKSKTDPFYWRFVEFGTSKMAARGFLAAGAKRLPDTLGIVAKRLGAWFDKTNASGKVVP